VSAAYGRPARAPARAALTHPPFRAAPSCGVHGARRPRTGPQGPKSRAPGASRDPRPVTAWAGTS